MTTRAPSLPNTPLSFGLGLFVRPFLPLRNPNIPPEPSLLPSPILLASVGKVASWRASSDQLPLPSRVTCTPPVGLVIRWPATIGTWRARKSFCSGGGGAGRTGRPCRLSLLVLGLRGDD